MKILGFTSIAQSAHSAHKCLGFEGFRAYLCTQRVRSRVPGFQVPISKVPRFQGPISKVPRFHGPISKVPRSRAPRFHRHSRSAKFQSSKVPGNRGSEVQSFKVPGFQGSRISFQGSRFQDSRKPMFLVQVASTVPVFQKFPRSRSFKVPGFQG